MYFWKTNELALLIKKQGLTQKDKKNYYLATSITTTSGFYAILLSSPQNIYAVLAEAAGVLCITIFGITTTFYSNGGNNGSDYVGKMVALSLPLMIKSAIIGGLAFGIILGVYDAVSDNNSLGNSWAWTAFSITILTWIYWRLNVHLRLIRDYME